MIVIKPEWKGIWFNACTWKLLVFLFSSWCVFSTVSKPCSCVFMLCPVCFHRFTMVSCHLSCPLVSTLECVCSKGKICVDLFIKAHLDTFKVERSDSRNASRCCSEWMWLPEGNISPLHTSIYRGWALARNANSAWYDAEKWLIRFIAVIHSSAAIIFY